jgi:hypothetical protein
VGYNGYVFLHLEQPTLTIGTFLVTSFAPLVMVGFEIRDRRSSAERPQNP